MWDFTNEFEVTYPLWDQATNWPTLVHNYDRGELKYYFYDFIDLIRFNDDNDKDVDNDDDSWEENNRGNHNDPCVTESFIVLVNITGRKFSRDFASLGLWHDTVFLWDFPLTYGPESYGPGPLRIVWAK